MWFDKILAILNNPAVHADTIGIIGYDPIIDIGYDFVDEEVVKKDVKISGLWSGISEKKQRAEDAFKKYSDLFQQFNMGQKTVEDVECFVTMMKILTPEGTDMLKLFNLLQNFPEWKEGKKDFTSTRTTASLQPVQDEGTIDTIKALIVSLEPDVPLAGDAHNINDLD